MSLNITLKPNPELSSTGAECRKNAIRHSDSSGRHPAPAEKPAPVGAGPQCWNDTPEKCWTVSSPAVLQGGFSGWEKVGRNWAGGGAEHREDGRQKGGQGWWQKLY